MSTSKRELENFFNDIFKDRMFTLMSEETNNYAHQKIHKVMEGRDYVQQMDHYSHHQHARLGMWKDLNASDMKIFTAHLLVINQPSTIFGLPKHCPVLPFLASTLVETNSKTFCGIFMFLTQQKLPLALLTMIR